MTEHFQKVAATVDIEPGKMMRVEVDGRRILICNVDGSFFATDDTCTHEDASLFLGCLQGEYIKCPLHGSRFNVRTGEVQDEPADDDLRTYPLRIEGDDILVDLS